jgi:purine-binding chemotaxis protein CheW
MDLPLVVFTVMGVDLAVRAAAVTSVSASENHTPLPGAPPHILGLVTNGDRIVALVDLARFLELPVVDDPNDDALFYRTLFVRAGEMEAGLRCNRARGLRLIDADQLREPKVLQGSRLAPFLDSELDGDKIVGVLNLPALLEAAAVP